MLNRHSTGWLLLALVLGVGLIHGLVFVFVVPPWQHNDEPNHFEYAWLVAHRSSLPKSADYDSKMSRAVTQSMVTHHFFDGVDYLPDLASGQPLRIIGYSQLGDPPLYYMLASLPIWLVGVVDPNASIETQLYAARLASLALLLISLLAAWGLVNELFVPTNPLRWVVPLTLALWPGYIDMMTAVTNIAGAVAIFSLFIWFSVRLIQRGVGWLDISGAVFTAAACLWTFSGVYIAAPLLGLTFLFALFRKRWRWVPWGLSISGVIIALIAIVTWGDADLWYRETWQDALTRSNRMDTPLGKRALQLVVPSQWPATSLFQLVPPSSAKELSGKTVTLGAWMWANHPLQINSPSLQLNAGNHQYTGTFKVTETPAFHAFTAILTGETAHTWVILSLPISVGDAGTVVFFDGVVLAEGSYPLDVPPIFDNSNGTRGLWGNLPFVNLVRNPSAERAGLRIRLWADRRQIFNSYGRVSMMLYASQDWAGAGWYYRVTTANLFRTLWGRFGWNHVPFLGHKPYRFFLAVTLIGLAGAVVAAWRMRKKVLWDLFFWLVAATFLVGMLAIVRGVFYLWFKPFIPSARYFNPVMMVIMIPLCAGWYEVLRLVKRWLPTWVPGLIYIALFLGLDIYALASLISFYY